MSLPLPTVVTKPNSDGTCPLGYFLNSNSGMCESITLNPPASFSRPNAWKLVTLGVLGIVGGSAAAIWRSRR